MTAVAVAAQPATPLPALIAAECETTKAFVELLQDEQESLLTGEAERLAGIAQQKSSLALKLRQLGVNRNRQLAALGLPADRRGVERLLMQRPDASIRGVWNALMRLAESARQLNHVNGIIIRERLRYVQQAVAALSKAAQGTALYGPDGGARVSTPGRRFGAA